METFQYNRNNELESVRAQWNQSENLSDTESVIDNNLVEIADPQGKTREGAPRIVIEESWQGEVDTSLNIINDLLNPFNTVVRYLSNNGYISKIDKKNQNNLNTKLLAWIEEFSQNFYYAFIAKALLSIGKGILNPTKKLIPSISKLLSRDTLLMWALMAVIGSGYKFAMEKLRTMTDKHDKINTIISIGLAAFSLLHNKSKMKKNYMFLFLFWKYLEMMSKILEKGKVIKKVKKLEVEFYELALLNLSFRFSFRVNVSRKTDKE